MERGFTPTLAEMVTFLFKAQAAAAGRVPPGAMGEH
jgi:hypothetical protein